MLLPSLPPSHRAMLRSQAGPHAGAWLTAIPSDAHTALAPETMQIAPAGCGCRSRWLRESAGIHPITDVGNALTTLETIRWRAPGLGCSLGALKSWNGLGAESRARPWALKGTSCPNNGSPTLPRRASPQISHLWSDADGRGHLLRCHIGLAVVPEWPAPRRSSYTGWGRPDCGKTAHNGANGPRTRSSPKEAPKPSACSGARSGDVGTPLRYCSCSALSSYAREGPRLPCAAPPRRHGRGASYRWQSSAQLATRHWGGRVVPGVAQDRVPCPDEILALAPTDGPSRLPWR